MRWMLAIIEMVLAASCESGGWVHDEREYRAVRVRDLELRRGL